MSVRLREKSSFTHHRPDARLSSGGESGHTPKPYKRKSWLSAFSALSSAALFSVAGAWTITGDAGPFLGRFAPSPTLSQSASGESSSTALFLAGVSGEALVGPNLAGSPAALFSVAPISPMNLSAPVVEMPVAAERIVIAEAGAPEFRRPAEPQPHSESHHSGAQRTASAQPVDPNAPTPDYVLVFAQQPASARNPSVQAVCLRGEWPAVVEPLIMNLEPKAAVVHNL